MHNFMRRFVPQSKVQSSDHTSEVEDHQLALTHLKKLFSDFKKLPGLQEQNAQLYNILPLFCKLLSNSSATDMIEKFPDVHVFCTHVSRLLVKEVKSRATNQSTEEASSQIADFLSPQLIAPEISRSPSPSNYLNRAAPTPLIRSGGTTSTPQTPPSESDIDEAGSQGWLLLNTLNILSTGPPSLLECMSTASLPSTLVKCLYIFFDLPSPATTVANLVVSSIGKGGKSGSLAVSNTQQQQKLMAVHQRSRQMLYTVFKQVLQRLCTNPVSSEELARKDDLGLLFAAVASWCPPHNSLWRKAAADVLLTLAQNGLTPLVIQHISDKKCIAQCLQNVTKDGLQAIEVVDMFVTLFHFLRESSDLSQTLLDDFRNCQGYTIIAEFLLKLENENNDEAKDALRNLVCLVGRLTTCGFIELRPKPSGDQLFTIQGFEMPQPHGNHESVRNIQAFHVLHNVFLKAQSEHLCEILLEVIKTVYYQDPANYFILDPQNTMAEFTDVISTKPYSVQVSYFDILESLVMRLKYVPMKEVTRLTMLIKSCNSPQCVTLCLRTLLKLSTAFGVFKNVYRDLGVLECAVGLLDNFAKMVRASVGVEETSAASSDISPTPPPSATLPPTSPPFDTLSPPPLVAHSISRTAPGCTPFAGPALNPAHLELGQVTMIFLSYLLAGSPENAAVFRTSGGARCLLNLVPYLEDRNSALDLVQQMVLTTGGQDDMATLLGLMHTAVSTDIILQTQVLQSLCVILRESHRCRSVFRKVKGFVYVMEKLVHMEGCLLDPPKAPWDSLPRSQVLTLLKTILTTLTVAMKYEPANARHFVAEVRYASLTEAIRFLGCFGSDVDLLPQDPAMMTSSKQDLDKLDPAACTVNPLEQFFFTLQDDLVDEKVPKCLLNACFMTRCLYDMAMDTFDKSLTRRGRLVPDSQSSSLTSQNKNSVSSPHPHAPPLAQLKSSAPLTSLTMSMGPLGMTSIDQTGSQPPPPPSSTSCGDPRESVIVHPGAILCILHLIPAIQCETVSDYQLHLQIWLLTVLKSLLRQERNQQVMCDVGMPHDLLTYFQTAMIHESHQLNPPVQYLFERLASQSLTPKDLREFLRLGSPLCCSSLPLHPDYTSQDSSDTLPSWITPEGTLTPTSRSTGHQNNGPVSIARVKCLVAMTTPRDARLAPNPINSISPSASLLTEASQSTRRGSHSKIAKAAAPSGSNAVSSGGTQSSGVCISLPPPFVEFDMSHEGFGCLFLPSISPHGVSGGSASMVSVGLVTSLDNNSTGGIGVGERLFPPTGGFTFSTWVCIDHFSPGSPISACHPVRLITLVRGVQGSNEQIICLSAALLPTDRTLVVSTKERLISHEKADGVGDSQRGGSCDTVARFQSPILEEEGRWHHIVLVFHRSGMMKHSSCSLYLDGAFSSTHKLNYISPNVNVSGVANSVGQIASVCAYVGTPPSLRRMTKAVWRQGPFHLIEEALNSNTVTTIYQLGPNYVGSFQAPMLASSNEASVSLFPEEKLTFGVFGFAISVMTIARMRKVYNPADAKAISRQLQMTVKENATPIRLLHNAAAHLSGPARCIGAVLVGYQGVRVFTPKPVVRVLESVGGTGVLLGLVAMVTDKEGLYAAVKALCCVVRSSPVALREMIRTRGYQMLAMLFKKKRNLLNNHILCLTYSLAGTMDTQGGCLSSDPGVLPPTPYDSRPTPVYTIANRAAFEDLLCDLEVWRQASGSSLLRQLVEHLCELAGCPRQDDEEVREKMNEVADSPRVSEEEVRKRRESSGMLDKSQIGGRAVNALSSAASTAQAAVVGVWQVGQGVSSSVVGGVVGSVTSSPPQVDPVSNLGLLLEGEMVSKLLHLLLDPSLPMDCVPPIIRLMTALLFDAPRPQDLRKFAQFMAWTLPQLGTTESHCVLKEDIFSTYLNPQNSTDEEQDEFSIPTSGVSLAEMQRNIALRNSCLEVLVHLLIHPPPYNLRVIDELQKVVGFDWVLLFLQDTIHPSTVVLATRVLLILLALPVGLARFREGQMCAGWLKGTDEVLKRRHGLLLVQEHAATDSGTSLREINRAACQLPGFGVLLVLLPHHCRIPHIYFLIIALLLGNRVRTMPKNLRLELDSLYNFIFGDSGPQSTATPASGASSKNKKPRTIDLCPEAAYILLAMIRSMMNQNIDESDTGSDWMNSYPITLIQFLQYLYQSNSDFQPLAMTPEFLTRLASTLFPLENQPGKERSMSFIRPRTDSTLSNASNQSGSNQSSASSLCNHKARPLIVTLIKMIVTDSLSVVAANKPFHLFDILLEGGPDGSTVAQQKEFQTLLINTLIEHLLAAEILTGQNLPLPLGGVYSCVPNNVFHLAARAVDKLWQGMYQGDCKNLVHFNNRLLSQSKKRPQLLPSAIDSLHRCLFRLILYQLSRPFRTVQDQVSLLMDLSALTSASPLASPTSTTDTAEHSGHAFINGAAVLASQGAVDHDMLGGLVHLVMKLSSAGSHYLMYSETGEGPEADNLKRIGETANSLWTQIYIINKNPLEDLVKGHLNPLGNRRTPLLSSVIPLLEEPCLKAWTTYVNQECNGSSAPQELLNTACWGRSKEPTIPGATASKTRFDSGDSTGSFTSNLGRQHYSNSSASTGSSGGTSTSIGGPISSTGGRLQQQFSLKLKGMSTGMMRLASGATDKAASVGLGSLVPSSGSSTGAENKRVETTAVLAAAAAAMLGDVPGCMQYEEARLWIPPHVAVVKELFEFQYKQYKRNELFMCHYLESEWEGMEQELTRERGLWGPSTGDPLDKWMLDTTEAPGRMRKKMIKNPRFYEHYPHRYQHGSIGRNGERAMRYRVAMSKDTTLFYRCYRSQAILPATPRPQLDSDSGTDQPSPREDTENTGLEDSDLVTETADKAELSLRQTETLLRRPSISLPPLPLSDVTNELPITSSIGEGGADEEAGGGRSDGKEGEEEQIGSVREPTGQQGPTGDSPSDVHRDSQAAILRLLEPGEHISLMFRTARIQGLDVYEGLLLFGRDHFYVIDGFTLVKTRDIVDIDSMPEGAYDPIVPVTSSTCTPGNQPKKMYFKFLYEDIREVQKRRYLLQPIALEVFNTDGRNFLLVFPKRMQQKIYMKFNQMSPTLHDIPQQSVSGQKQSAKIESGSVNIFNSLIGEKSVTQRWERGELTNFQYLMYLNTLAGRSYNDLMQYPIFPWILADYDSEHLDLTSPATFRDLSKPMGAQHQDRVDHFLKRYSEWDDPSGETPPYHYGTHYSSAMIVASYLIRMEPFTQHFLKLQGGHFDLADRMFHCIRDAWLSASQLNMADVKELIPEFFYLPDFLVNSNNFDLGVKQNGIELGDVLLPPWAKGDPREFIRAHREALECDYVSAHLHEWIDLIFGYKQRDAPAEEAINVFHHLFYEGNVDIYSIDDPLKRSAVIGFINNFGQIPSQLFRKPHPAKRLSLPPSGPRLVGNFDPASLVSATGVGGGSGSGAGGPVVSSAERMFYHNLDVLRPSTTPVKELKSYVGQIVQAEGTGKVMAVEQNKCLIAPTYSRYLAWGYADASLRIGQADSDKTVRIFEMADADEILCAVVPNERTIVTGGISTTVRVWQIGIGRSTRVFSLKAALYGHTEAVTCLAASASWNLLVSGSRDRSCILWDLSRLVYLRQLSNHAAPVACLYINEGSGDLATCAGTYLHLWTVNGDEIASVNTATGRSKQILTVSMSTLMDWDTGNVIMTGGTDGVVRMWGLDYVQVPIVEESSAPGDPTRVGQSETPARPGSARPLRPSAGESVQTPKESRLEGGKNVQWSTGGPGSLKEKEKEGEFSERKETAETDSKSAFSDLGDDIDEEMGDDDAIREAGSEEFVMLRGSAGRTERRTRHQSDGALCGERRDRPSTSDVDSQYGGGSTSGDKPSLMRSLTLHTSKHNVLRPGFRWQRQLMFRSKLTMHTAYERMDNQQPAAVTALAISPDHRIVYVGDARGRVFSWSVPGDGSGRGGLADHWVKDEGADCCASCSTRFTITERKHHCRNCGHVFCSKCTRYEIEIYRLRLMKPVRVCQTCFLTLRALQTTTHSASVSSAGSNN